VIGQRRLSSLPVHEAFQTRYEKWASNEPPEMTD
jgi:hypothetical protein